MKALLKDTIYLFAHSCFRLTLPFFHHTPVLEATKVLTGHYCIQITLKFHPLPHMKLFLFLLSLLLLCNKPVKL